MSNVNGTRATGGALCECIIAQNSLAPLTWRGSATEDPPPRWTDTLYKRTSMSDKTKTRSGRPSKSRLSSAETRSRWCSTGPARSPMSVVGRRERRHAL